jgi:hypothetical protein
VLSPDDNLMNVGHEWRTISLKSRSTPQFIVGFFLKGAIGMIRSNVKEARKPKRKFPFPECFTVFHASFMQE